MAASGCGRFVGIAGWACRLCVDSLEKLYFCIQNPKKRQIMKEVKGKVQPSPSDGRMGASPTGAGSKLEARLRRPRRRGWVALMPLVLLAALMGTLGLCLGDFYKVPMTVVFLLVCISSLLTLRGYALEERIEVFSRGAGSRDLLLMVWIFVLAGAFAKSAQAMGAVSAMVDLTMALLPGSMLLAGLFVASCIVSLCVGTSVGTIVALVPVAAEMSQRTGCGTALMVAAVVGGAFFGDNLSFISDTTVAATRTQDCTMRDKFRTNFRIVMPAALVCLLVYLAVGLGGTGAGSGMAGGNLRLWRVLPYAAVLFTAVAGMNVLLSLCLGLALTGLVGMADGSFGVEGWLTAMAGGIGGMGELILISMMAGGLLAVVRRAGGVTYLVRALTRRVHSRRGAEVCIGCLVSVTNLCTANNTVAILSVGPIVKDIASRYGVDRRRAASLLDIFSCVVQGVIPYGAQLLMASGLAPVSPVEIIPWLFYPMLLALSALVSVCVAGRGGHAACRTE